MKPPHPLPEQPARILVIRPDHLGDLILAAPALPALRALYPDAKLTAWLGPWGEPVWQHHPSLDAIESCPFPGFTRGAKPNPLAPYALAWEQARALRGRFDLAINLRFDFWWGAMAACWAGIPVAGYDVPECRPFLAKAVGYQPGLHETDQNLRLVEAVAGRPAGPLELPRLWPEAELPPELPTGAIAIHTGAGAEVKRWEEARWAAVADELAAEAPIALTAGSDAELAMAERIRSRMSRPALVVSGLSLAQLAAFYRRCRLVLGPDNGPLHVARSVGTPTVTLFGPSDPQLFGPRKAGRNEVLRLPWRCVPCGRLDYNPGELAYHLCVKLIEPEQVLAAARRVLAAEVSRPS
ncbi:MAG TPA: glycosyltransferase family 9 protein [Chloroflexota bacterium]